MRSAVFPSLFCLLVLGLLAGPSYGLPVAGQEGQEPPEAEGQEELPPAEVPKTLVIPEEEKNRKNPIEATSESVELGGKLFRSQCFMCHGKKGDGTGDLAQEMGLVVPDFTDPEVLKKRTDGELHYILVHGHDAMPGQGERLRAEQKWSIINFLRTLPASKKSEEKK